MQVDNQNQFGQIVSPILKSLSDEILIFNAEVGLKPNWPQGSLEDACIIFMSVFMDKIWDLQEKENWDMKTRENAAEKAGAELRSLIKTYTGINMWEEVKKNRNE